MRTRKIWIRCSDRPWSLNGAHLILKEWPSELSLSEIDFETSTFYMQIHGLPPMYLHDGTARMIGGKVGFIHPSLINRRCVVAHRFLRFRVEIAIKKPLPAGFFLEKNNGNDIWVQFKFEHFSDFCYCCGCLDHITGRCKIKALVVVTTPNGNSAKLFGPWLELITMGVYYSSMCWGRRTGASQGKKTESLSRKWTKF